MNKYENFPNRNDTLKIVKPSTIDSYAGYLSSWSAYRDSKSKETFDPLITFATE